MVNELTHFNWFTPVRVCLDGRRERNGPRCKLVLGQPNINIKTKYNRLKKKLSRDWFQRIFLLLYAEKLDKKKLAESRE